MAVAVGAALVRPQVLAEQPAEQMLLQEVLVAQVRQQLVALVVTVVIALVTVLAEQAADYKQLAALVKHGAHQDRQEDLVGAVDLLEVQDQQDQQDQLEHKDMQFSVTQTYHTYRQEQE
jgi:hypothetical protein